VAVLRQQEMHRRAMTLLVAGGSICSWMRRGGRARARGKARAGYVGSRDAMQRLGLHENL
jgi:hypothetical protein